MSAAAVVLGDHRDIYDLVGPKAHAPVSRRSFVGEDGAVGTRGRYECADDSFHILTDSAQGGDGEVVELTHDAAAAQAAFGL